MIQEEAWVLRQQKRARARVTQARVGIDLCARVKALTEVRQWENRLVGALMDLEHYVECWRWMHRTARANGKRQETE